MRDPGNEWTFPRFFSKVPPCTAPRRCAWLIFVEGGTKCLPATFKQFKQYCSVFNRSSLRASSLVSNAVFRRFSTAFFQFKNAFQERVQSGFRFHERWNFVERMLTQLFTTDSLDRPFIQGLFRRLHPGGTSAVKWILSTLVKPDSVDTILQQQANIPST